MSYNNNVSPQVLQHLPLDVGRQAAMVVLVVEVVVVEAQGGVGMLVMCTNLYLTWKQSTTLIRYLLIRLVS